MTGDPSPAVPAHPVCSACGATAPGPAPMTWSAAVENGLRVWTCDACARRYLRSIEGKLDAGWW